MTEKITALIDLYVKNAERLMEKEQFILKHDEEIYGTWREETVRMLIDVSREIRNGVRDVSMVLRMIDGIEGQDLRD